MNVVLINRSQKPEIFKYLISVFINNNNEKNGLNI